MRRIQKIARYIVRTSIAAMFLASAVLHTPAITDAATCPTPNSSNPQSYQQGYTSGCTRAITGATDKDSFCVRIAAPSGANATDWVNGCYDGFAKGSELYTVTASSKLADRKMTLDDVARICQQLTNKASEYASSNPLIGSAEQNRFNQGCIDGYIDQVNTDKKPDSFSICNNTDVIANRGCLAGYNRSYEDYRNSIPLVSIPFTAEMQAISSKIRNCNTLVGSDTDVMALGYRVGCVDGYREVITKGDSLGINCTTAPQAKYKLPINEGYKQIDYNNSYTSGCIDGIKVALRELNTGVVGSNTNSGGGIVPQCDPVLPPNTPGACGLNAFVQLIKNIIKWLTVIILPIIFLMIGYAGFKVMTSGGSSEKVSQGITVAKTAILGLVYVSVSYLVIKFIFDALGVATVFRPSGL